MVRVGGDGNGHSTHLSRAVRTACHLLHLPLVDVAILLRTTHLLIFLHGVIVALWTARENL